MSFAVSGVTICENCGKSLSMNEYGLCNACKEKEKRKGIKNISKVYKGYELIKAIADGEIKEGSRFIDTYAEYIYKRSETLNELTLYKKDEITEEYSTPDYSYFADNENEFELIEDETIDIDDIEELEEFELDQFINMDNAERFDRTMIEYSKINKIIRAVKQLNKEIKSIKEK